MVFLVVPKLPAAAMAIYPIILVKKVAYKTDEVLINHEKIHHRQQLELLILPFYILYLLNYLLNLIRYRNRHQAYLNIIFEREAFSQEHNLSYLEHRRIFAWMKYTNH